jgi:hypothetical protein
MRIVMHANVTSIVTLLLLFSHVAIAQLPQNENFGCENAQILAKALSDVNNQDWSNLSVEKLQELWPTELKEHDDCRTGKEPYEACTFLIHEGRVIDNSCQCCERFLIQGPPSLEKGASLRTVFIKHSARELRTLITIASIYATAVGSEDLITSLRLWQNEAEPPDLKCSWQTKTYSASASMQLRQDKGVWIMQFILTRFPL